MDKISKANKLILIFAGILIAIYVFVFSMPQEIDKFALIPAKLASGEFWRLLTFQFAHLNSTHLLENIMGAGIAAGIATELKMRAQKFSWVYLLAGMFAVIPIYVVAPFVALGASGAIYGAFGAVSMDAKKFGLDSRILIGLLAATIIAQILIVKNVANMQQGAAHFTGLVIGVALFLSYDKVMAKFTTKRRKVLRGTK
jgi:membrane associated rhomboid family serine protease